MTVSEAFLIVVDDLLSLYLLASPTAVRVSNSYCRPVSTGYPGGDPGIELLNLLGVIIESRETQDRQWSLASKFGFGRNFAHDENVFHHSFTLVILIGRNVF